MPRGVLQDPELADGCIETLIGISGHAIAAQLTLALIHVLRNHNGFGRNWPHDGRHQQLPAVTPSIAQPRRTLRQYEKVEYTVSSWGDLLPEGYRVLTLSVVCPKGTRIGTEAAYVAFRHGEANGEFRWSATAAAPVTRVGRASLIEQVWGIEEEAAH